MKVYTRTGDEGTTSLANSMRVSKADARVSAVGALDELNAHIGMLVSMLTDEPDICLLETIQHRLFTIGGIIAYLPGLPPASLQDELSADDITLLEQAINQIAVILPPQTAFILPSGCPEACQAHICRTVCRRAERSLVALLNNSEIERLPLLFLNRLSDYLFVLARKCNFCKDIAEKKWQKHCK